MYVLKSKHNLFVHKDLTYSSGRMIKFTEDINKAKIEYDLSRARYCRTYVNNRENQKGWLYKENSASHAIPVQSVEIIEVDLKEKA